MANIASAIIPQGSHSFNLGLPFVINGYADSLYHDVGDTWEVRIVNPEGILLVKTFGIQFPVPTAPIIFFPIAEGDLDKAGVYTYQVAKTTDGANIKAEVDTFVVEESAPSLVF